MILQSKTNLIKQKLIDQYLGDNRPWIIGYSGGKDSTMLVHLVFQALDGLKPEQIHKSLHIISNNTLVENPLIIDWINKNIEKLQIYVNEKKLPIHVNKIIPYLNDTFWVNLIGRGYPAPLTNFRWCTERLKINPTSKYIKNEIDNHGEVIILLGTRFDESSMRSQTMQKYQIANNRLKRHPYLNLAYTYSPLQHLKTEEVWEFLETTPNPWGISNSELAELYGRSDEDDLILIFDKSAPPSGNSRFGCWVCTLVEKDRSMENFIRDGQNWMRPLLEFRDWIKENRNKDEYRMNRRRNGNPGKGPYTIEKRGILLRRLLEIQKKIGMELITDQELKAIQAIWQLDGFNERVYDIYKKIYESNGDVTMNKSDEIKKQHRVKLATICEKHDVNVKSIEKLISEEKNKSLSVAKKNIQNIILEEINK